MTGFKKSDYGLINSDGYLVTTEEILASEERIRKREELEKKMNEERQEKYIKYVKERLRSILNNNELLSGYYNNIDKYKSLLGYEIDFKKDKNLKLIFIEFEKRKISSNSIGDIFLNSGEDFIKHYFTNIDKKMNKSDFILFISFLDYEILVKLLIVYEIFIYLPDNYKKLLIDSTNENIHYSIVKCHPKYANMFSNIFLDDGKKKFNDEIKVENIKEYWRNKLQNKK